MIASFQTPSLSITQNQYTVCADDKASVETSYDFLNIGTEFLYIIYIDLSFRWLNNYLQLVLTYGNVISVLSFIKISSASVSNQIL